MREEKIDCLGSENEIRAEGEQEAGAGNRAAANSHDRNFELRVGQYECIDAIQPAFEIGAALRRPKLKHLAKRPPIPTSANMLAFASHAHRANRRSEERRVGQECGTTC